MVKLAPISLFPVEILMENSKGKSMPEVAKRSSRLRKIYLIASTRGYLTCSELLLLQGRSRFD